MKDVNSYQQHHVAPRLVEKASSSQTHRIVADDIAIIGMGKTKAQTESAIHEAITKHLIGNFYFCGDMFLSSYNKLEQAIADINAKQRIGLADLQLTFNN